MRDAGLVHGLGAGAVLTVRGQEGDILPGETLWACP